MKLYYIDQRKVFPFLQPVEVWDEQGNVRYRLKSKGSVGLQLHLLTPYDEEVASIRQKISLGTKFIVNVNDKELTVRRTATWKGERYYVVNELNWKAEGFLVYRTYQITAGEQQIAQVRMVEFSKGHKDALYEALKKIAHVPLSALDQGNCCEIEFSDDQNEAEVLAVVMAIEAALSVESE
ncbi:MAG: hypothetical protein J5753_09220 [Oscillospiraceae bacterium]|nr:hypothetical protein [Oscillospiraceae bacterium]